MDDFDADVFRWWISYSILDPSLSSSRCRGVRFLFVRRARVFGYSAKGAKMSNGVPHIPKSG